MSISEYETLLIQLDYDFDECSETDLEIFLSAAHEWFKIHLLSGGPESRSGQMLDRIIDAIVAISTKNNRESCAIRVRVELEPSWVFTLHTALTQRPDLLEFDGPDMRRLLHALKGVYSDHSTPLRRGRWAAPPFILSQHVKESLCACLETAHKNIGSCDYPNCAWVRRTSDERETLPFLPLKANFTTSPSSPPASAPEPSPERVEMMVTPPSSDSALEFRLGSSGLLDSLRARMARVWSYTLLRLSHPKPSPILPVSNSPPPGLDYISMDSLSVLQEADPEDASVESEPWQPPTALGHQVDVDSERRSSQSAHTTLDQHADADSETRSSHSARTTTTPPS